MSKHTFSSFKELLIKKELSDDSAKRSVDYRRIAEIFQNCSIESIRSNCKHFEDAEQASLKKLLKKLNALSEKPNLVELENLSKEALSNWSNKSLLTFSDLLENEAKAAATEAKKIEKLAKKYQPKDLDEEFAELQNRIKEIQMDIVDIEMNLMQMEKSEQKNSERYKKNYNARERRKQVVQRLEKQIQGLKKKRTKQNHN